MEITYLGGVSIKIKTKTAAVTVSDKITFEDSIKIVDGPGEYDIKEVSIIGVKVDKSIIYIIEAEGLRLLHLGALDHKLSEGQVKDIGNIDVCMLSTKSTDEAVEIVRQIEPTITIPMDNENVDSFTTAIGSKVEKLAKLSIKSADLAQEEAHVVILEKK